MISVLLYLQYSLLLLSPQIQADPPTRTRAWIMNTIIMAPAKPLPLEYPLWLEMSCTFPNIRFVAPETGERTAEATEYIFPTPCRHATGVLVAFPPELSARDLVVDVSTFASSSGRILSVYAVAAFAASRVLLCIQLRYRCACRPWRLHLHSMLIYTPRSISPCLFISQTPCQGHVALSPEMASTAPMSLHSMRAAPYFTTTAN